MNRKTFWRTTMTVATLGLLALAAMPAAGAGPWPAGVRLIDASSGTATTKGDLANGVTMDLAFAAKSSMACFPATENVNFNGKHILFGTSLPKNSEMTITVTPLEPTTDISVYAYTIGSTSYSVPPSVSSCVACEGGYDAQRDSNPGVAESVKLTAITNPYNVVIGVAGANGQAAGTFRVKVDVKPRS